MNEVPGLVLRVKTSSITGVTVDGAKVGTVELRAEFTDDAMWLEVRKRLDGFKMHTIDDFHAQLLIALRMENDELTKELERTKEQCRAQVETLSSKLAQAEAKVAFLDEDNRRLMQQTLTTASSDAVRDLELLLQKKS